jgi:hypothetical protein
MTDKLNEMWAALTAYQAKAEESIHGYTWSRMCSLRTEGAANTAAYAAKHSPYASSKAVSAAYAAAKAAASADAAIDYITKAQKETK